MIKLIHKYDSQSLSLRILSYTQVSIHFWISLAAKLHSSAELKWVQINWDWVWDQDNTKMSKTAFFAISILGRKKYRSVSFISSISITRLEKRKLNSWSKREIVPFSSARRVLRRGLHAFWVEAVFVTIIVIDCKKVLFSYELCGCWGRGRN